MVSGNSPVKKWVFNRCLYGRSPQKTIRRRRSRVEANAARQEEQASTRVMRASRRVTLDTPATLRPSPSKDELKQKIYALEEKVHLQADVVSTLSQQNDRHITDLKGAWQAKRDQTRKIRSIQAELLQAAPLHPVSSCKRALMLFTFFIHACNAS